MKEFVNKSMKGFLNEPPKKCLNKYLEEFSEKFWKNVEKLVNFFLDFIYKSQINFGKNHWKIFWKKKDWEVVVDIFGSILGKKILEESLKESLGDFLVNSLAKFL